MNIYVWLNSLFETLMLTATVNIVAVGLGTITALLAWKSNTRWAFFTPVLILSVPPWLFSYHMSDVFGYIDPWLGATLSLGITCSIYSHVLVSASLSNRSYNDYEMLRVIRGDSLYTVFQAVYPSLKISLIPSFAIISAEVLSDFGVAHFYGINTLTMLTYNIWSSTWNFHLLLPGIALILTLSILLSQVRTNDLLKITACRTNQRNNIFGILAILPAIALVLFSLGVSIYWIIDNNLSLTSNFIVELRNSLLLISIVIFVVLLTLIVYLSFPNTKNLLLKTGIATYAIPGTVIGALFLFSLGWLLPLILLLAIAIATRFFGLTVHSLAAAEKGSHLLFEVIEVYTIDNLSKLVMKTKLLLAGISVGICLMVLDILRELPITIILQPMDFVTLATRMNYVAKTGYIPFIGMQSVVILLTGIILTLVIIGLAYARNKKS